MSFKLLAGALALAAVTLPTVALADDPRDPAMQSQDARERDAAMIRKLNRDMLAQVQARDAKYAKNWQAYRDAPKAEAAYRQQLAAYERDRADFAAERQRYQQARAKWERDVAACRAGDYSACD